MLEGSWALWGPQGNGAMCCSGSEHPAHLHSICIFAQRTKLAANEPLCLIAWLCSARFGCRWFCCGVLLWGDSAAFWLSAPRSLLCPGCCSSPHPLFAIPLYSLVSDFAQQCPVPGPAGTCGCHVWCSQRNKNPQNLGVP